MKLINLETTIKYQIETNLSTENIKQELWKHLKDLGVYAYVVYENNHNNIGVVNIEIKKILDNKDYMDKFINQINNIIKEVERL